MTITASCGRIFATFPVALLAFVVNQQGEFLLLRRKDDSSWEIPSGAMEHGESPRQGLERELREELGPAFQYQVLGPVHITSVCFDESVPTILSLGFVVQYVSGDIVPGDDMAGADYSWCSLAEIGTRQDIAVPNDVSLFGQAQGLCGYYLQQGDRWASTL